MLEVLVWPHIIIRSKPRQPTLRVELVRGDQPPSRVVFVECVKVWRGGRLGKNGREADPAGRGWGEIASLRSK